MTPIKLTISETHNIRRDKEFVCVSVPFPLGCLSETDRLTCDDTRIKSIRQRPLSYWPDGTVRWAQCFIQLGCNKNESFEVELTKSKAVNDHVAQPLESDKDLIVDVQFSLEKGKPESLTFIKQTEQVLAMFDEGAIVQSRYSASSSLNPFLRLELVKTKNFISQVSKFDLTIHNTNRALHPNGQWDLGDPNSLIFDSLYCLVNQGSKHSLVNAYEDEQLLLSDCNEFTLIQHSSGGKNWQSNVHVDRSGKIPFKENGYILAQENTPKVHGKRVAPILTSGKQALFISDFWQNFPSSLEVQNQDIKIGLFPSLAYLHELLPGEKKTHSFSLFDDALYLVSHQYPLNIVVCPHYVESCQVIPFYSVRSLSSPLNDLIKLGLDDEVGFEVKRELIDEYGWRNYGDLYADHENEHYKGEGLIVSHYNNQYDPLFGFLNQYLKTGDRRWWDLAEPLAKHVMDIDIYHTTLDKDEYNHGLFWHTDHYVDAKTAGHRTYSKNQPQNVYMDHAGGGGPGGQHCYTSGLALYYWLTGDDSAKRSVIDLTNWITNVYEGSGGVFDFLLSLKNRNRQDLKNPMTNNYPLDRGTGNYITALQDCYLLTGKQHFLDKASLVIKQTVSPDQELSFLNLGDVENSWFYTVFLQAVCRYIDIKSQCHQIDESYEYSKQILIKFGHWMAKNEVPYLTKPDILEFPNQTWTAQDLRKVGTLKMSASFLTEPSELLKRADAIEEFVELELQKSDQANYCRVLCLLMQNIDLACFPHNNLNTSVENDKIHFENSAKPYKWWQELTNRLVAISPKDEVEWLRQRSAAINKLFDRN